MALEKRIRLGKWKGECVKELQLAQMTADTRCEMETEAVRKTAKRDALGSKVTACDLVETAGKVE